VFFYSEEEDAEAPAHERYIVVDTSSSIVYICVSKGYNIRRKLKKEKQPASRKREKQQPGAPTKGEEEKRQ
jgi:hypothetical protein